jgi:alpha-tubulin suppressor-like RCC1 family protein
VDCRVNDDEQVQFKSVVCGSGFCMALTLKGNLYTWGKYANGRLGLGNIPVLNRFSRRQGGRKQFQQFQLVPKRIEAFDRQIVHKIVCGDHHTLALVSAADDCEENKNKMKLLFAWGKNTSGQLGCGRFLKDTFIPQQVDYQEKEKNDNQQKWTDIAAGSDWSLALDSNGHVWTWGALGRSVLGHSGGVCTADDTTEEVTQLLLDQAIKNWKELSIQKNMTAEIKEPKDLLQQQQALPRFSWIFPRRVETLCESGVTIRSIAAGQDHVVAISTQGDLYTWGKKSSFFKETDIDIDTKKATTTTTTTSFPTLVTRASHGEMGDKIVESVFCGGDKTIVITGGNFLSHSMKKMYTLCMENANKKINSNQEEDEQKEQAQALGYCDMITASDTELIVAGKSLYAHKMVRIRKVERKRVCVCVCGGGGVVSEWDVYERSGWWVASGSCGCIHVCTYVYEREKIL